MYNHYIEHSELYIKYMFLMPTMYYFWFLEKHPQSTQDPFFHGEHSRKGVNITNCQLLPLRTVLGIVLFTAGLKSKLLDN